MQLYKAIPFQPCKDNSWIVGVTFLALLLKNVLIAAKLKYMSWAKCLYYKVCK